MAHDSVLKIIKVADIDSTNSYAFRLAECGQKEVTVISANSQNLGKGRYGHNWTSPANGGIYASFILRPPNPLKEINLLPFLLSLCVRDMLLKIVPATIKWPNDILVGEKKISGILVEARGNINAIDFAIAGVGININAKKADLPPEATSLYIETSKNHNQERIFNELLSKVISLYKKFKKGNILQLINGSDLEIFGKNNNLENLIILK